jgi:protein-tyrosine sulfotransferase
LCDAPLMPADAVPLDAAPLDAGPSGTGPSNTEPRDQPVFVLTGSRSGSTLLRFILDSHPDLACPPETSIASACASLAHTWNMLEGVPGGDRPVHEPAELPAHGLRAVRDAADQAFSRYLGKHGKRRWCDKSLDSHMFADLMIQLYPEAKFICLYRHCMDVIASAVEACPWGITRYGFDPFVAQNPGNSVAALGSYWLATVSTITAFEQRHPGACHRVRYEDLVTAPEQTAAGIFSFLGERPVPGITRACFRSPHEGSGFGDEKIWFTDEVTTSSMGRGVRVPVAALPGPLRQAVNEALSGLGYRTVDDEWNAAFGQPDPRAAATGGSINGGERAPGAGEGEAVVAEALRARIGSLSSPGVAAPWPTLAGATVALVVESAGGEHRELHVAFDPAGACSVTAANGHSGARPVATLIAEAATWRTLLDRRSNLVTEITGGRLRCVNKRDGYRIRSDEVHAIATVLGLAQVPDPAEPGSTLCCSRVVFAARETVTVAIRAGDGLVRVED